MNFIKVTKHDIGETCIAEIEGLIDTATVPRLEEELLKVSSGKLVLDMRDVSYITSAGLRLLLILRKKYGNGNFKCVNVSDTIENIFCCTGFNSIIPYETNSSKNSNDDKQNYVSLLRRNVLENGDNDAYIFLDKHYTWRDIDIGSQIIADHLAEQNVQKGSHVAIMSQNSINWILAFYAIQKLGAIAVLVNFALKPAEVASLAETADITHFCYGEISSESQYI